MDDQRAQWHSFSDDLQDTDLALHSDFGFRGTLLTSVEETPTLSLMRDMSNDQIDLLCCSPETLMSSFGEHPMWIDRLTSLDNPVSCLVIDKPMLWVIGVHRFDQISNCWVGSKTVCSKRTQNSVCSCSLNHFTQRESELRRLLKGFAVQTIRTKFGDSRNLYFHIEIQNKQEGFDFSTPINRIREAYGSIPLRWYEDQGQSLHRPPCIIYTPQNPMLKVW